MTHIHLTVNGDVEMDDDIGSEWQQKQPAFIRDHLKPGKPPAQWIRGVMIVIAESIQAKIENTTITVTHRPAKWSMEVEHA